MTRDGRSPRILGAATASVTCMPDVWLVQQENGKDDFELRGIFAAQVDAQAALDAIAQGHGDPDWMYSILSIEPSESEVILPSAYHWPSPADHR